MKPLKEEVNKEGLTVKQHRDCMVDLAKEMFGCCIKYKDGSLHQVQINSNNEITIDDYDPWYEFDDEDEVRNYIETDNEAFDNYIRWKRLQSVFDEDEEINDDIFKK